MKLKVGIAMIAAAAALASQAGEIKWGSSYKESLATAKAGKRLVMIDFYTDWCGWCKKLDADTYPNDKVVAIAEGFVNLKIDAEKGDGPEIAKKYKVSGYPTIVFVDGDGTLVAKQVGYQGPEDFAATLTKTKQNFEDYEVLKAKVEANPKDVAARLRLAEIYATREDLPAAQASLEAAEKLDKGNKGLAPAYNAVGDVYQNSGKYAQARTYFEKAAKLAKDGKTLSYANLSLAACYASEGKMAEALKYAELVAKQKDAPKTDVDVAKQMVEGLKKAGKGG